MYTYVVLWLLSPDPSRTLQTASRLEGMPCQTHYFSKGLQTNSLNAYLWKQHEKSQLHFRMTSYEHPFNCRFYTFSHRKTQSIWMSFAACGLQEPAYVMFLHIFPKESRYLFSGSCWLQPKETIFCPFLKFATSKNPKKK